MKIHIKGDTTQNTILPIFTTLTPGH